MGWWIALGILTLLAVLPLGIAARYDSGGAVIQVIAGPVRFPLYPSKRKKGEKKPRKKAEKKKKTGKKTAASGEEKKTGGSVTDFLPLLRVLLDFLGSFRRKLRVNRLEMKLILASDDPGALAMNYGRAWAALGNLLPQLERLFVIRKRDLQVECDFTANQTTIFARLDLTITLGRLLALLTVYGIRTASVFSKIQNKRKGGA